MKMPRLVTAAVIALTCASVGPAQGVLDIVRLDVSFEVVNKNDSRLDCASDGASYQMRGSIVGPRSALESGSPPVTLYVHGGLVPELWRFPVEGYDFVGSMAERGFVSATIDLLGYGGSMTQQGPDGSLVCGGSQADMTAQVARALRLGAYQVIGEGTPTAFAKVAVAGLSGGGRTTEVLGYSFPGVADALMIFGWSSFILPTADPATSAAAAYDAAIAVEECSRGGVPKTDGGPSGYTLLFALERVEGYMFTSASEGVAATWLDLIEKDPCGDVNSVGSALMQGPAEVGAIDVPVLLGYGENDVVFGPPTGVMYSSFFTGSDDVTLQVYADRGHVPHLDGSPEDAVALIDQVADWLAERGFHA